MALNDDFQAAVARSKELPERPANDQLLELYALYKQATDGDVSGEKPGMFDFVAKAKYDAWEAKQGMASEDAMQAYVDYVAKLEDSMS
jgi:diazepam-binding inhibitor (GABA receptor modulating acyl-CoA-binding protein)